MRSIRFLSPKCSGRKGRGGKGKAMMWDLGFM